MSHGTKHFKFSTSGNMKGYDAGLISESFDNLGKDKKYSYPSVVSLPTE